MHNYLRLLRYTQKHRIALAGIFVLTLAAAGLATLQPWPMKVLVDHVLAPSPNHIELESLFWRLRANPSRTTLLWLATASALLIIALNVLVDAALAWAWTVVGRRMVNEVSADLFRRLQRRSLFFHRNTSVGDNLSRITGDSWCVYQAADSLLFAPAYAALIVGGMIVLMIHLDRALTGLTLLIAPLMVAASMLLGKPLRAAAKTKREIESRIQSHIQQTLTGIPVVQAFSQEPRENVRFRAFAEAAIRSQQRGAWLGSINSLSSGLVAAVGSGVILWIGAQHVLAGTISLGSLLVFIVYLNSLQAQLKTFAGLYTNVQNLSASMHRVVEILSTPP